MSIAPEYKEYAAYVSSRAEPRPMNGKVPTEVALGMKNLDRISQLEAVIEEVHALLVKGDLLCELTAVQKLDPFVKNPCYGIKKS